MTDYRKKGITNDLEEQLSKRRAAEVWDLGLIDTFEVGTFRGLQQIHEYLFQDVFLTPGEVRNVDIAKGNFRFASHLYLSESIPVVERMPEDTFEAIVEKYVEMNILHPFREGNGRSGRIWLDCILKARLGVCVDWSQVGKEAYLSAMERSPVNSLELKVLLESALTDRIGEREVFIKGIEHSYYYEGYEKYEMTHFYNEKLIF